MRANYFFTYVKTWCKYSMYLKKVKKVNAFLYMTLLNSPINGIEINLLPCEFYILLSALSRMINILKAILFFFNKALK